MSPTALRILLALLTLALCGLGLVMVGSTTTIRGVADGGLNFRALMIQGIALLIGASIAVTISIVGLGVLRQRWFIFSASFLVAVMLFLVPLVSAPVNGAYRWFDLGPIKIQPAELAKVMLILMGAWYLVQQQERVRVHWHGVLMPLLGFGFVALLVYRTQDLGSVVVMALVLWAMMVFAGARWLYFTALGIASLPLVLYVTVFSEGYRRDRMLAFRDPWAVEGPAGYHLQQSELAIASGGTHGMGLGQGASKQGFLPEFHTDFIYAIICEELGMIGGVAVVLLFLCLVMVGLSIANRCDDRYARLVAVGATMLIGFQAFWNMLVVVGAVPTKGLTLPFISYGGTSLVVSLAVIGLLDAAARTIPSGRAHRSRSNTRIGAAILRRSDDHAQGLLTTRVRPWG
ncbi:MAG: cell division protein FtsW [Planctomycetota bacterium]|nr:MAG: cell division protein FtsW [Planctomycetota bacterium]